MQTFPVRRRRFLGQLVGASLLLATAACAKSVVHEADDEEGEAKRLAFDPATVETLHGRILEVQANQRIADSTRGVRVLFTTGDEELYAYLAPQEYFEQAKLELVPGELVTLRGSVLDGDGRRVVIVESMTIGTARYGLRDAEGRPKWHEWRFSSRDWK